MEIKTNYKLKCKRCDEIFSSNEMLNFCPICVEIGQNLAREYNIKNSNETATLRDQFAMAALTGVTSNGYIPAVDDNNGREFCFTNADYARKAYGLADAMMEARKR